MICLTVNCELNQLFQIQQVRMEHEVVHKFPLPCPQFSTPLSTFFHFLVHKSPLSCPQISAFVQKPSLCCPPFSALLSRSLPSLVQKSPLFWPQVSALLSTSFRSLVHKSLISCAQVSTFWIIGVEGCYQSLQVTTGYYKFVQDQLFQGQK